MNNQIELCKKAETLSQALPYIQKYSGKTVVVKYGGAAMEDESLIRAVISDIVLLSLASIRMVVVHGGGRDISDALKKTGKESRFVNGLRHTDAETMEVVQMVLAGKIGKNLAALAGELGGKAISLSGMDGGMMRSKSLGDEYGGRVGEIQSVDPHLIEIALDKGYIPMVSTVSLGMKGESGVYNINADTAASEIAVAMNAENLILLTDVRGILTDKDDDSTLIPEMNVSEIPQLMQRNIISGGMIPKVECCVKAVRRGVKKAIILDGRLPHSILMEMLTDGGVGSMIKC